MEKVTYDRWLGAYRAGLRSASLPLGLLVASVTMTGLVVLGDRTPSAVAPAIVASLAAGLIVGLVPSRPLAAFGLLILLASLSKETLDLSVGRARLEQPAILSAILALALSRRWPRWAEDRPARAARDPLRNTGLGSIASLAKVGRGATSRRHHHRLCCVFRDPDSVVPPVRAADGDKCSHAHLDCDLDVRRSSGICAPGSPSG